MKTRTEIEALMKKAEAGDAGAQNDLACAYYNGDGLDKNIPMAMSWFEVSASNGNMYAQSNLAYRYRYGTDGFDKDLVKAFDLYKKSAEQGYVSSQETLGVFYSYGYGTQRNDKKAVEWYTKAALKGMTLAQNNLGIKYEYGDGVEKNYYKAVKLYLEAATHGDSYALCNLGIMFEEGRGVEKNFKRAIYWYKKSADNKHQRGKEKLERLKKVYDENTDRFILAAPIFIANPYRILGVFSNATVRELTANKSKVQTFAKVGRTTTFPCDYIVTSLYIPTYRQELFLFDSPAHNLLSANELYIKIQEKLSQKNDTEDSTNELQCLYNDYESKVRQMYSIRRTSEDIERAIASINQPLDKIKYALFWFIKASSLDEEALKYAMDGNIKKARDLWKDDDTFSSLVNSAVVAFILDDDEGMVQYMTKMIHNDGYRQEFVSAICGKNFQISEEELAHVYIDTLLKNLPSRDWRETFKLFGKSADDDEYIDSRLAQQVIDKLEKEILKTKAILKSKGLERYNSAVSLVELSRMELYRIEDLIGKESIQYQSIADKVAEEVLKCAQDYYQQCSTTIYQSTQQCVELNQYAYDIVVSTTLKERFKELLSDIKDRLTDLPPEKAVTLLKKIDGEIEAISKHQETSKKSLTHIELNSLRGMQKLADAQCLLLKCAPYIAELKELLGCDNRLYLEASTKVVSFALTKVIAEINEKFDAADAARKRNSYLYSYGSLELANLRKALTDGWQVFVDIGVFDMEDDFKKNRYLPNRETMEKHMVDASLPYITSSSINLQTETEYYNACKTIGEYKGYLTKYPNGKHSVEAKLQIAKLEKEDNAFWRNCLRRGAFATYLNSYKNGLHSSEAKEKIKEQEQKEDNDYWATCSKAKLYSVYLDRYKNGLHSSEAKEKIKEQERKEDSDYWALCSRTKMYSAYVEKYPVGLHYKEAERILTKRKYIGILSCVALVALVVIITIAIS